MIMRFKFEYDQVDKIKKLAPETYEQLRQVCNELPEKQDQVTSWGEHEGHIEKVIDIVGPVTVTGRMTPWITSQFLEMAQRLNQLESKQNVEQTVNNKVNVHVPGLGLLMMREVQVREDCCTDSLQKDLDDGWRILAICPQPDQRRPDYVIGRTKGANDDNN